MKYSFLVFVVFLMFSACKKEEVPFYQGEDGISFYLGQYSTDSISYSFAFQPIGTEKDTILLYMRVLGAAKDYPRSIHVVPGAGTTAREGIDFVLPETTLPAGELTVQYPVVIFNTPEMLTQTFRIVAQVAESKDFVVGASLANFKILVSNRLDRPAYWDTMVPYFGEYSETKFRFMISTLGITDFSYEYIGIFGVYDYPIRLRNALAEYEDTHGPLIDEFGNRVEFPTR